MDKRHSRRLERMQILFARTFLKPMEPEMEPMILPMPERLWFADLVKELPDIDRELAIFASERPLTDINKVDLAILRMIVFEGRTHDTPKKVLVDEAIELAKEFGTENSPKFINGVLGKILFQEYPSSQAPERNKIPTKSQVLSKSKASKKKSPAKKKKTKSVKVKNES
jgi:transcription antitermination factor NusB